MPKQNTATPAKRGRPRIADTAGLPGLPSPDVSEVAELEAVLAYVDAQLLVASPRDAAALLRQRLQVSTALRDARQEAEARGRSAVTYEERLQRMVDGARDRENGWPDSVAEAVWGALCERFGRE